MSAHAAGTHQPSVLAAGTHTRARTCRSGRDEASDWSIAFWQFNGAFVVSGSLDTSIKVWDAETGTI